MIWLTHNGVSDTFQSALQAGFLLASLLQEHPAMKAVVATEVERFVFRPGLKDRAQYYAVIFLNQMVLSHKDSEGVLPGGFCRPSEAADGVKTYLLRQVLSQTLIAHVHRKFAVTAQDAGSFAIRLSRSTCPLIVCLQHFKCCRHAVGV